MLEFSQNSFRMSIKLKQSDELESFLCDKFAKFMMKRAEKFHILRRVPLPVIWVDLSVELCTDFSGYQ